MSATYRYEVATRDHQGRWRVVSVRQQTFELEPRSIAHALMVRWILDHWDPTLTGRIHVFGPRPAMSEPSGLATSVRVRVYRAGSQQEDAPLAAAYLGDHERGEWFGRRFVGWLNRARRQSVSVMDHRAVRGEAA